MCGIFASVSTAGSLRPSPELQACLRRRGPDYSGDYETKISGKDAATTHLSFFSTVLALRGDQVTKQPLVDTTTGSVLCWNGEAWAIDDIEVTGNDGLHIHSKLAEATNTVSCEDSVQNVLRVLCSISGPFAFVFYDSIHSHVYFGRDCLGRRSLLHNSTTMSSAVQFSSASISSDGDWLEVEADGTYLLDCSGLGTSFEQATEVVSASEHFPFSTYRFGWPRNKDGLSLGKLNAATPSVSQSLSVDSKSVAELEVQLRRALSRRLVNIPDPCIDMTAEDARVAVLFSGGLDCTVLARIAHDIVPRRQAIDLLNVAFENPRVVQAAKKVAATDAVVSSCYEACPDRITGWQAFRELRQCCPGRKWRFVQVNVPYSDTLAYRSKVISLIHPHKTEMDLSIGYALYFASRGLGVATMLDAESVDYSCTARVLLSGLGADELFGGYTRHRTAFSRHGFKGLIEELELDVNRLGKRNLGRDDRVLSNWGRETRFPYLDEGLVRWALDCPVWEKCGFGESVAVVDGTEDLESDKKVLRLLAHKLQMPLVAREKKRAIQFGARTAKMETGRTKGTTVVA